MNFNQKVIPHSKEVYFSDTVQTIADKYDIFIAGSDQIWNLKWYHPIYFLDFLPRERTKISYAASLAMEKLNKRQKSIIKKSLRDFKAISLREESTLEIIAPLVKVKPQNVLDPTLLLSKEEWDKHCKKHDIKNYIFCYFLGDNQKEREIALKFASNQGLKIVSILQPGEKAFGDVARYDASPEEFLGYIKDSAYVFTDSFHAVVFSFLYNKQYFVFNRNSDGGMSSRIKDVLDIFNTSERFCLNEKDRSLARGSGFLMQEKMKKLEKFEKLKKCSINFLLDSIKGNKNEES